MPAHIIIWAGAIVSGALLATAASRYRPDASNKPLPYMPSHIDQMTPNMVELYGARLNDLVMLVVDAHNAARYRNMPIAQTLSIAEWTQQAERVEGISRSLQLAHSVA